MISGRLACTSSLRRLYYVILRFYVVLPLFTQKRRRQK